MTDQTCQHMINYHSHCLCLRYIPYSVILFQPFMSNPRALQNRFIMSIVNYLLAPAIATIATNQSCFYYLFNLHAPVTSLTTINVCETFYIDPTNPSETSCLSSTATKFSTLFYPQFQYSYACGSALLVTYIPVLMYTYIAAGFIAPLGRYFLALNPILLRPFSIVHDIFFVEPRSTETKLQQENEIRNGIIRVRGPGVVVTLVLHSTVLLTFGMACPILGIAVAVTIINDSIVWKLLVGRYLIMVAFIRQIFMSSTDMVAWNNPIHAETIDSNELKGMFVGSPNTNLNRPNHDAGPNRDSHGMQPTSHTKPNIIFDLELMELDNKDAWRGLFCCCFLSVWTVVIFWALLFFDMVGDIYTDDSAMACTLCYGVLLSFVLYGYSYIIKRHDRYNVFKKFTDKFCERIHLDEILRNRNMLNEGATGTNDRSTAENASKQ